MMRSIIVVACLGFLSSCATAPKTYHAPSDAKVKASTIDLNVKVTRARDTAAKAKSATEEARDSAKRLIALAKTTSGKIEVLQKKLPAEYRLLADEVKASFDAQTAEEEIGRVKTNSAIGWNAQLEAQLGDAERARVTLQNDQNEYAGGAASLAQEATNERNYRIKAEKSLSWYRWHWYLGFIILGAGVVICAIFAFLKFTGRLALKIP